MDLIQHTCYCEMIHFSSDLTGHVSPVTHLIRTFMTTNFNAISSISFTHCVCSKMQINYAIQASVNDITRTQ